MCNRCFPLFFLLSVIKSSSAVAGRSLFQFTIKIASAILHPALLLVPRRLYYPKRWSNRQTLALYIYDDRQWLRFGQTPVLYNPLRLAPLLNNIYVSSTQFQLYMSTMESKPLVHFGQGAYSSVREAAYSFRVVGWRGGGLYKCRHVAITTDTTATNTSANYWQSSQQAATTTTTNTSTFS